MSKYFAPIKTLFLALVLTIAALSPVPAGSSNEIASSTVELQENSIEYVSFLVLANISLEIFGSLDGNVNLLVLQGENYLSWSNQLNFTSLLDENITSSFNFQLDLLIKVNATLHIQFINTNQATTLEYTIRPKSPSKSSLPILEYSSIGIIMILGWFGILTTIQKKRK